MDEYYEIWGRSLDILKAFDKVWYGCLVLKSVQSSISGNLRNILEDFLRNRKQKVVLNGQTSNRKNTHAVVPHLGTTVVLYLYRWFNKKLIFKSETFSRWHFLIFCSLVDNLNTYE